MGKKHVGCVERREYSIAMQKLNAARGTICLLIDVMITLDEGNLL